MNIEYSGLDVKPGEQMFYLFKQHQERASQLVITRSVMCSRKNSGRTFEVKIRGGKIFEFDKEKANFTGAECVGY